MIEVLTKLAHRDATDVPRDGVHRDLGFGRGGPPDLGIARQPSRVLVPVGRAHPAVADLSGRIVGSKV